MGQQTTKREATPAELVKQIIKANNGNIESLAGWCIGYIGRIERDSNEIRRILGAEEATTLIESLNIAIENTGV